jgi:TolB protein
LTAAQTELISATSARPVISPDGRFIACYYIGEPADGWQIAILPIEGGTPVRIIKPPDTVNLQIPLERPLAWSPDNRFIYYLNDKDGISNVFRIAVEGSTPERVTRFTSGRIFAFSLSPDGKRMALARGSTTSDIVIFRRSK